MCLVFFFVFRSSHSFPLHFFFPLLPPQTYPKSGVTKQAFVPHPDYGERVLLSQTQCSAFSPPSTLASNCAYTHTLNGPRQFVALGHEGFRPEI